jgi:hypothetical protein
MRRRVLIALLAVASILSVPALAPGHPERTTKFPDLQGGGVPRYRNGGPTLVVCKRDSLARVRAIFARGNAGLRRQRLAMLRRCRYRNIQAAVNDARSGDRILIMPGVYEEQPSRAVPVGSYHEGPCANDYVETEGFSNNAPPPVGPASNDPPVRPDRNFQVNCPNAKNLIEVVGDPRHEDNPPNPSLPACLQKCNLQISGYGRGPGDVVIVGDRRKADVLRIDRANGIYLSNFTVEQAEFNDVDVVEVNGFRLSGLVVRYAQNYGALTFTSGHGLYDHVEAYGNGDSGVYPGSNPKGCDVDRNAYATCEQGASAQNPRAGCGPSTTELRQINSHDNVLGYSGTAGNSTWVHDSHFHDNNTGLTTDSFAAGHPGMPQECFLWEHNVINSNNQNFFTAERQDYCNRTPFLMRPKDIVCPQFQTAVGTGVLIGGGNRDLLRDNWIFDNWRWGAALIAVPASLRGDNEPSHQQDTSNGNQFLSNRMGVTVDGQRKPNGVDFFWDEEGVRNCWSQNNSQTTNVPTGVPGCPGSDTPVAHPPNPATDSMLVPCTAWDPQHNPRPVACNWFDTPPRPS